MAVSVARMRLGTTEFDQTRFTVVELQAKLGETSSECVQICLRLGDCLLLWY
jgi:hypothetical protein